MIDPAGESLADEIEKGWVGMWRVVGRYLAGAMLAGLLVLTGVVVAVATPSRAAPDPADAIVVLGAAQYDGTPSPVFASRLDLAAALYRDGTAPRVITLGAKQQGDRFTEAQAGANYLAESGVPRESITEISDGGDTLESLRAVAPVLRAAGTTSVVLVTDPAHAHRSALMARDLGLQVQVAAVVDGPASTTRLTTRYVLRESAGTLFYLLVGGSGTIDLDAT